MIELVVTTAVTIQPGRTPSSRAFHARVIMQTAIRRNPVDACGETRVKPSHPLV